MTTLETYTLADLTELRNMKALNRSQWRQLLEMCNSKDFRKQALFQQNMQAIVNWVRSEGFEFKGKKQDATTGAVRSEDNNNGTLRNETGDTRLAETD